MGKAPLIPVTDILTDRIPEAKTKKKGRLITCPSRLRRLHRPLRPVPQDEPQPIPHDHLVHQGQEEIGLTSP